MFRELAKTCRLTSGPLAIYPSASCRDAWEALDADWNSGALAQGQSYLHYLYPQ